MHSDDVYDLTKHLMRHPVGCRSNLAPWANADFANDVQNANMAHDALEAALWETSQLINERADRMRNQPAEREAFLAFWWPWIAAAEQELVRRRALCVRVRAVADAGAEIWRAAA